ncbi:nuclear transport factor 2 family protein [Streptomyces sp. CBMA152]|uniref:nuclear transport factor 2 family protein n=1 Tax=Streptomyces sp. CBMA152 TaxID=1896312 RepID=UPI0016616364|nr:nuclear transport factor 2 family protein [Streptomyces sp. CBMA152]MBD0741855.1 hydroxylacyl-CoA dehydrogenase [Streptomyces sp. CBMA152]
MTAPAATAADLSAVSAESYAQILQFYAHHMQLLDGGDAEGWADGFTEDGVFAQNVKPEPWSGRSFIATSMRRGIDRLAARDVQRRHWFSMVVATPGTPGAGDEEAVRTTYYAVVFETPRGGKASVYLSTTGADLLVRRDGQWLIKHRDIFHDGV